MTTSLRPTTGRRKTTAPPISQADIAHRAFELFAARGGQHGHDVEDWLRAEHELTRAAGPQRPAPAKRTGRRTVAD
jgi:hypothetical protein